MLRPQTWYLLLAAVVTILTAVVAPAGTTAMLVVIIAAAVALVAAVPLYGRRRVQALVALVAMALLVVWYVLLAVLNRNTGGDVALGWAHALPAVAVVLAFLARRGILHDERVVKAYDRIR